MRAAAFNQDAQDHVASLKKQLATQQKAATASQRSLDQARSDHKAKVVFLEEALIAAKQDAAAAKEMNAKQAKESTEEASRHVQVARDQAQAYLDAALQDAERKMLSVLAEVQEVSSMLADMQAMAQQCQQATEELVSEAQLLLKSLRPTLHNEVNEFKSSVLKTMAGLEVRCQALADDCSLRVSELLQLDAQVSTLGPEGVNRLCREVQEAQQRQAHAEAESRQIGIKLAECEANRGKLAVELQVKGTELGMLVQQQAELKRELAISNAALEHSKADVAQLHERAAQLACQADELAQKVADLETAASLAQEGATEARKQTHEAKAKQEEIQAESDRLREASEQALQQAAAAFTSGARHAAIAAVRQLKALKDKYFQAPLTELDLMQQQHLEGSHAAMSGGSTKQDASLTTNDQGLISSTKPQLTLASSAAREDVFGVRLCRLSHEDIMSAFQDYNRRQSQLDIQALQHVNEPPGYGAGDAAMLRSAALGSFMPETQQPQQQQQQQGEWKKQQQAVDLDASITAACSTGVMLELLWLEGCLLLTLVEGRQAKPQLDRKAEQAEEQGKVAEQSKKLKVQSEGTLESNAAKDLAKQMVRAMARDRKLLQQRVHQLEHHQASPSKPSRSPSTPPYLPPAFTPSIRRSLSAHTHSAAKLLKPSSVRHQHQQSIVGTPPPAAATAEQQQQCKVSLKPAAGQHQHSVMGLPPSATKAVLASGLQHPEPSLTRLSTPAAAAAARSNGVRGPTAHNLSNGAKKGSSDNGCTLGPATSSIEAGQDTGTTRPLTRPSLRPSAAQNVAQQDDDDVWRVLEVLEESNLRASRGMHGLHSAGGGSARRAFESSSRQAGSLKPLPFDAGLSLSPGQAFVAKYRESRAEGGKERQAWSAREQ